MSYKRITIVRIDPESTNVYSSFSHPGLAVSIIGTVLKAAGYPVTIYVDAIRPPPWQVLADSDLVAMTVNTASYRESYRLADRIRREVGCPVIYGGPHVTFLPEEALRHGDFVVRGKGRKRSSSWFGPSKPDVPTSLTFTACRGATRADFFATIPTVPYPKTSTSSPINR